MCRWRRPVRNRSAGDERPTCRCARNGRRGTPRPRILLLPSRWSGKNALDVRDSCVDRRDDGHQERPERRFTQGSGAAVGCASHDRDGSRDDRVRRIVSEDLRCRSYWRRRVSAASGCCSLAGAQQCERPADRDPDRKDETEFERAKGPCRSASGRSSTLVQRDWCAAPPKSRSVLRSVIRLARGGPVTLRPHLAMGLPFRMSVRADSCPPRRSGDTPITANLRTPSRSCALFDAPRHPLSRPCPRVVLSFEIRRRLDSAARPVHLAKRVNRGDPSSEPMRHRSPWIPSSGGRGAVASG